MGRPKTGTHSVPTVERILQAAEQAFGAQGFTLTRLEDIAEVASIRRPSLLYHFSTKQKLYEAVDSATIQDALSRSFSPDTWSVVHSIPNGAAHG